MEQDPRFVFRILVDIASKGLSPAINDPTTAVLAIDQIHHLLRRIGARSLDEGRVHDSAGRLRLVYRTPDWEDFVHLAVTEIRQFGCEDPTYARRWACAIAASVNGEPPVSHASSPRSSSWSQKAWRLFLPCTLPCSAAKPYQPKALAWSGFTPCPY